MYLGPDLASYMLQGIVTVFIPYIVIICLCTSCAIVQETAKETFSGVRQWARSRYVTVQLGLQVITMKFYRCTDLLEVVTCAFRDCDIL